MITYFVPHGPQQSTYTTFTLTQPYGPWFFNTLLGRLGMGKLSNLSKVGQLVSGHATNFDQVL